MQGDTGHGPASFANVFKRFRRSTSGTVEGFDGDKWVVIGTSPQASTNTYYEFSKDGSTNWHLIQDPTDLYQRTRVTGSANPGPSMPIVAANYSNGGSNVDTTKRKYYSIDSFIGGKWQTLFDIEDSDTGNPNVLDMHVSGRVFARDSLLSAPGRFFFKPATTPFGTDLIYSVAYGNSVFVAVSSSGKISRSTDGGATWSTAIANSFGGTTIRGVCFGNGVFVAVGSGGKIARSTDNGASWSGLISNSFGGSNIVTVSFGDNVFIAAGVSGKLARSTDNGVTWSFLITTAFSGTETFNTIAFGNGVFVAGGGALGVAGRIIKSNDDGVTWSAYISNPYGALVPYSIVYGLGVFISVGGGGSCVISRSLDGGVTWSTAIANPFSSATTLYAVCFVSGIFIAISDAGTVSRSLDIGLTWGVNYGKNDVLAIIGTQGLGIAASPQGRIVVVGYDSSGAVSIAYTDYVEAGAGIVESGSNPNGSWIKFDDGTMECCGWGFLTWISGSQIRTATVNFPVAFIDTNIKIVSGASGWKISDPSGVSDVSGVEGIVWASSALLGVSSFTIDLSCYTTVADTKRRLYSWVAIGKWK